MKMTRMKIPMMSIGAGLMLAFTAHANAEICCGCAQSGACCDPWAGPYFGVHFGAGYGSNISQSVHSTNVNDRITVTTFTEVTTPEVDVSESVTQTSGRLSGHASGSFADLFVGYNFHPNWFCSRFILSGQLEGTFFNDITYKVNGHTHSLETDTSSFTVGETSSTSTTSSFFRGSTGRSDELHSTFNLVGRVGYLVTPCLLAYGLAGVAEGNFVLPCCDDDTGFNRNRWETGYTVGAGLEYKLNEKWSVLAEYRFLHFDIDRSRSGNNIESSIEVFPTRIERFASTSHFQQRTTTDFNFNYGTIGIVYRFC